MGGHGQGGQNDPDKTLLSLKALVLLVLSTGAGVAIYVATGRVVDAATVAIALLIALNTVVR